MDVGAGIAPIRFDRAKYGRPLRIDANELRRLRGFITEPRPHRLQFHEIVLVEGAPGRLEIDGASIELRPGRVCFSAPGEVRCWRLGRPLAGHVVCFEAEFVGEFVADAGFVDGLPFFVPGSGCRHVDLDDAARPRVLALVQAMERELCELRADAEPMLRAQLHLLLAELTRAARATAPPAPQQALHQRFRALLEQDFRRVHRVGDYARRLGVTPARLNAALQRAAGRSAVTLLHERLHLEARRLLLYSDARVAAVAQHLGFADASYFHRFFRRLAGTTPQGLRERHGKSSEIERR